MKPTLPSNEIKCRRDSRAPRHGATVLSTDCYFQPPISGCFGYAGGECRPSFRQISSDYFRREVHGHFATELFCFALIAVTIAVPVAGAIAAFWKSFA